jgi:hypothetical protein
MAIEKEEGLMGIQHFLKLLDGRLTLWGCAVGIGTCWT